jgi:hypothetical protein
VRRYVVVTLHADRSLAKSTIALVTCDDGRILENALDRVATSFGAHVEITADIYMYDY